jgi:hypothetical protein
MMLRWREKTAAVTAHSVVILSFFYTIAYLDSNICDGTGRHRSHAEKVGDIATCRSFASFSALERSRGLIINIILAANIFC